MESGGADSLPLIDGAMGSNARMVRAEDGGGGGGVGEAAAADDESVREQSGTKEVTPSNVSNEQLQPQGNPVHARAATPEDTLPAKESKTADQAEEDGDCPVCAALPEEQKAARLKGSRKAEKWVCCEV